MIKVTQEEIYDFVRSQPDDKLVDMRQNYYNDSCGCLMVQYGKSRVGYSMVVV